MTLSTAEQRKQPVLNVFFTTLPVLRFGDRTLKLTVFHGEARGVWAW